METNYDPKAQTAFADPIVRCDSCNALVRRETIHKLGCCDKCGNRRMRNVLIIQKEEMEQCKVWNLDPDFLALFEETDEIKPTSPPKIPVPDVKPGYDLLDTTPQNEYGLDGEHIDVEDPHG